MNHKNIKEFPLVALRELVVLPYMLTHFDVGREISVGAVKEAENGNGLIFLVTQKDGSEDELTADNIYTIGTIAKIKQQLKLPNGNLRILVEGISRGELVEIIQNKPFILSRVKEHNTIFDESDLEIQALARRAMQLFNNYLEKTGRIAPEATMGIMNAGEPDQMADIIAANVDISVYERQLVLECLNVKERLTQLIYIVTKEVELISLEQEIASKVKANIDKQQREYHLREQMKVIQEELGEGGMNEEIAEYKNKMASLNLPDEVSEKLNRELDRLKKTPAGMGEGSVIRSYIEYILDLPWNINTKENISVTRADKVLNADHYGLEKVKARILEYISVRILSGNVQGSILCLVGPPGVGKTSIAKSIARSMNRNYVRISLGGVRDEADIRGHRKTYVGAMPGRIISAIKDAQSSNPLVLLDEIDKMGSDFRGDPSAALLEVLDSEQNFSFRDHYIELPFNLSNIMFITTANTLDTVPRPLLDRMEIIEIPGYTEEEKINIAEKYLIPKQIKRHGLKKTNLKIDTEAIKDIINFYTRESGVRSLERKIAALCRKTAKMIVSEKKSKIIVKSENLEEFLGVKIFSYDLAPSEDIVGVATGLAWTMVGGDTLSIEVNVMEGSGKIELTGSLGDVMKESAHTAISFIRSVADNLGIDKNFYKTTDIHVHVPEGATPKDGPSAGITMATAIVSALTGCPVRHDVAMTGEITLRGRVLPIGGLKEKSLAAYRAGIKTIIIPKENKKDLEEIPQSVKDTVSFVCASEMDKVLSYALVKKQKEYQKPFENKEIPIPFVPQCENTVNRYSMP